MRTSQMTRQSPAWIVLMVFCGAAATGTTPAGAKSITAPLAGADGMPSAPGPIARALVREAAILAVDRGPASAGLEWSRARKLAAGSEIIVTVEGSPPAGRQVVRVERAHLTTVNLTHPRLPKGAQAALRDVASRHPDYFSAVEQGATFVLAQSVRLEPHGVFVSGRKVAELGDVIEHIARDDIVEIKIRRKGRGVWGHLGPVGGYFVGALSGGLVAGLTCQAVAGRDRCDTGAFLAGMVGGGIAGGVYGLRAANRESEEVIYRAP